MKANFFSAVAFAGAAFCFCSCGDADNELPPEFLHGALLQFIPPLADRELSFVGSVAIEEYARSNLRVECNDNFRRTELSDGWVKLSWDVPLWRLHHCAPEEMTETEPHWVKVQILREGKYYRCNYIEFVHGSMGTTSGSFFFSVEARPLIHEEKTSIFHFIKYEGSSDF